MPSFQIPLTTDDVAVKVALKQAELEAKGASNFRTERVGDQYLVTYDLPSRRDRSPKPETR